MEWLWLIGISAFAAMALGRLLEAPKWWGHLVPAVLYVGIAGVLAFFAIR